MAENMLMFVASGAVRLSKEGNQTSSFPWTERSLEVCLVTSCRWESAHIQQQHLI